jgi:parallel beta-helix repeat protein
MPTKSRLRAAPATLGSLAAVVALAVVGVIALSGGQALASHVSCGDTITADTTLDSDLLNCPNNGILIGADGITLNLNGHVIDGDRTPAAGCDPDVEFCDFGVANDSHNRVTIKGGRVRDFGLGVLLFRARHNRLRGLSVFRNTLIGILMVRSARGVVKRSSASRNGLTTHSAAMVLFESHHNRIAHNRMVGSGDVGLSLEGSDHNHILHNRLRRHPLDGIVIDGRFNEIARNRVIRNGGGILISKVGNFGRIVGNVVRRNYVRGSRTGGIGVDPVARRTRLRRNLVVGSARDGIFVLNRRTKLTGNRAFRNGDLGIQAVRGVIDGGGNVARYNGDPRQCVNVKCR